METRSQLMIQDLQSRYGSADFKNMQAVRKRFYSFITYPEAGQATLTFFGSALGQGSGNTREVTNMPKANSFGQTHFLLKNIACAWKIGTWDLDAWDGDDTSTLSYDFLGGFAQAGVLEFRINSRPYVQLPKPFLYAPPMDGEPLQFAAGLDALTLNEATPNTIATYRSPAPYITPNPKENGGYLIDPNILIEAEQAFECTISYPSGLVPVIGTGVTDDTTNPLKVGVILDGIWIRPLQ